MMVATSQNSSYFPALTGVRAVAAYLVFIHHFDLFTPKYFGNRINLFFSEMHIGVTMFFVLSGLLICIRYFDETLLSRKGFYNFFVNRFARIYPLFFLIVTINFVFSHEGGQLFLSKDLAKYTAYFSTLSIVGGGVFINFKPLFVEQAWSITTEEIFYILCPIFFSNKKIQKDACFFTNISYSYWLRSSVAAECRQ